MSLTVLPFLCFLILGHHDVSKQPPATVAGSAVTTPRETTQEP